VVNDRWGNDSGPIGSGHHHGGYFSGGDRQQANPTLLEHKWENAFTLDRNSWGYARNDDLTHYLNITEVLYEVVSTVAYGGNALINIGPTHDGRIMTIFQERLKQLGSWLKINGEAIYASRKWYAQNDTAQHGVEQGVYYTASSNSSKKDVVYAFMMGWPEDNHLILTQAVGNMESWDSHTTVRMLGCSADNCEPIDWQPISSCMSADNCGMDVSLPPLSPKDLPSLEGPWVFELQHAKWAGHVKPMAAIELQTLV